MKNAMEKIIEYFNDNEETFADCIEELDSYNGFLGDDRIFRMDELSEIYSGTDPVEILQRAFFGYDGEHPNSDNAPFNPNRDYFCFNGYGNLVSYDTRDYSDRIDEETVEAMKEYRKEIYAINDDEDLSALFDELEAEDEEDETEEN